MTALSPNSDFAVNLSVKRLFDFSLSFVLLPIFFPVILFLLIVSSIDTHSFGLFTQKRVGQGGRLFTIYKIKTMRSASGPQGSITVAFDPRITTIGVLLRKLKLDELPQLFNVFCGQMSFVGPRPDVSGYADKLIGSERVLLRLKPGITGPASLAFSNEEFLLSAQSDPESYNREVIWPKKVELNLEYCRNWSLFVDFKIIFMTLFR